MKIPTKISLLIATIVFLIAIYIAYNPLIWTESSIKSNILKLTPIGTSMDEVEKHIKNMDWKISDVSEKHGFIDQREWNDPENYACNTGSGKLIHVNGYYDCNKSIKYEEMCKLSGGNIVMKNDSPECFVENELTHINPKKICRTMGGEWILTKGYDNCVVGSKSIRAELGEYRIFFITNVTVFWGFDDQGKLIDLWVLKTTDAT